MSPWIKHTEDMCDVPNHHSEGDNDWNCYNCSGIFDEVCMCGISSKKVH